MKRVLLPMVFALALAACSKPTDIVLGPEPLKQMAEQGDQFRKLPEADRQLLAGYLVAAEMRKALGGVAAAFGASAPAGTLSPVAGRTVGEVLTEARTWKAKAEADALAAQQREAEAKALAAKVEAEHKAFAEKLAAQVTVGFIGKQLRPKDYDARRYEDGLVLNFAVENKTAKPINQLKGRVIFSDATGEEIGALKVDFDEKLLPGVPKRTDSGSYWKINPFMNNAISKIAGQSDDTLRARFEIESIAFADGEVLKAPAKN